jgi:YD repeat-containing protein
LTITDPNKNVTVNTYDTKGNLTETKDLMDGVTKYTYDARGNVLTITDALGGR